MEVTQIEAGKGLKGFVMPEVIGGTKTVDGVTTSGRVHAVIQPKNKKAVAPPVIDNSKPNNNPNNNPSKSPSSSTSPAKDVRLSNNLELGSDQ